MSVVKCGKSDGSMMAILGIATVLESHNLISGTQRWEQWNKCSRTTRAFPANRDAMSEMRIAARWNSPASASASASRG